MKFRFILALLLLRVVCVAQTTSVTLQVTDADSQTWNNGTWSATLTSNASNGPFAILGTSTPVPNQSQSGALSASGGATMTLTPNASIGPLGTQWAFHTCPQATPAACYDFKASIQGASQNLTLTPPGIRISVVNPIIVVSTYQDLEITGQSIGSRYYNLTSLLSKEWNGSAWISITPGGVPGGSPTQLQINNSGAFGAISNVAAGSALVSNGPSALPIFQPKPLVDARDFSGSDWCAQVNAADTSVVGVTAIIQVPSVMSGKPACTASISITANHQLKFDKGSFNLGTQNARAGIVIGAGVNNVSITGAGRGQSILLYTSFNPGITNSFPNGSAIGIGTVTACTSAGAANNNIIIQGLTIQDQNTGSALASGNNPSGIEAACVNFLTIEDNELTDNKGNAAITATGNFGSGGGNTYINRNNIFDGTTAGGGGEFTGDNSSNWTHYQVIGNIFSDWPCAVGAAQVSDGVIANNVMDMTLKSPFSGCQALAIGAGGETTGTLANVWAVNNVITIGFSQTAILLAPSPTLNGVGQIGAIGNNVHLIAGSSVTGISINGTDATHTPPAMIVRNNTISTDTPTTVTGRLANVEVSGNSFDGIGGNNPLFGCSGTPTIIATFAVRVFGNHYGGALPGPVTNCNDATFSTRQFQEWDNTIQAGAPNSASGNPGFLGKPAQVFWTPGTIAPNSSTATQTVTVTQANLGDTVTIVNSSGGANWMTLPLGVIASGVVSSANTVQFNITNTTSSSVTINSGSQIQSYIIIDRAPNNYQVPSFILNGTTTLSDGSFGSTQLNSPSACETSFGITTLSTVAATTDTGQNCLPANAIIDSVVYRITTTIATAASFTIGDATTAARFCATQSTLTAGTTGVCFVQADQTGTAGPRQTTAAKVRVTLNATPGAGAIRLIVYYHTWVAPTS